MKKQWCIVGAGSVGTWVARDAVQFYDAAVILVDPNVEQLKKARATIKKVLGAKHSDFLCCVTSMDEVPLRDTHVLASCAPHRFNRRLAELAIRYRIPFCDLGGNNDVTTAQYILSHELRASTTLSTNTGVSPGLSNMGAVSFVKQFGCDSIAVYCGGNPIYPIQKKKNPFRYRTVFNPEGIASEYCGFSQEIVDGKLVACPSLSRIRRYNSAFESSPTSNNPFFVAKHFLTKGVGKYFYETLRYPGHFGAIMEQAPYKNERELALWIRSQPMLQFNPKRHRDRLTLIVEGSNSKNGHTYRKTIDVVSDPKTGASAMGYMTAAGMSIVANYIAQGKGPAGFALPEEFMPTTAMMELSERLSLVPHFSL